MERLQFTFFGEVALILALEGFRNVDRLRILNSPMSHNLDL